MAALPSLEFSDVVILAGAGVSIPSGIASGQLFNEVVLGTFEAPPSNPKRPLIRFEQLIGILRDFVDPSLSILGYLETSWEPSSLHLLLARGLAGGARLLTTNLESLIELACRDPGGTLPAQIADVDEWVAALLSPPDRAVYKLHGTLRRNAQLAGGAEGGFAVDTLGVTLDAIGRLEPSPTTFGGGFVLPEYVTAVLRELVRDRHLVVIGYSGSDDFDVLPSLRQLRAVYRDVYWITHDDRRCGVRRVGSFTLIRGTTTEVVCALFGEELPAAANRAAEARPRFEAFFTRWKEDVGLQDGKRRSIRAEILRQAGRFDESAALWSEALAAVAIDEAPRLMVHAARACIAAGDRASALEHLQNACFWYRANDDGDGYVQATLGLADVVAADSPNETLTMLAGILPQLVERYEELQRQMFLIRWPFEERCARTARLRNLEAMLMRGTLTLSRVARRHGLAASRELMQDVLGQSVTAAEMLETFARHPAVHEDKLLYADYLAELTLLRHGGEERHRELRELCRLLGLPAQAVLRMRQ